MAFQSLTDEDRGRFNDDGFIIKRKFFDAEEVAMMGREINDDAALSANIFLVADDQGGNTEIALWNHPGDDLFGVMGRCARLAGGAERLLDDEVYHYHAKLTMKTPGAGGAWNWHQDYGYWYNNGCLFPDMLSVGVAVDAATTDNGCLQVIRGSHKLGRIDHLISGGQTSADLDRVEAILEKQEIVACTMAAGDTIFFHCNTLHTSNQNHSQLPRTMLLFAYNTRHNDPYLAHHHPAFTPIKRLPDTAVKERGCDPAPARRDYCDLTQDKTAEAIEGQSATGD